MFNELFKGQPKFTYNSDNNAYVGITEFLQDHDKQLTYQVHGMFITKTGKYGPRAIAIIDGYNIYLPKHMNEIVDKIRNTPDMVEAINAGKCGLVFRDYEKDGQTHTTVDFVDYVPTEYAE